MPEKPPQDNSQGSPDTTRQTQPGQLLTGKNETPEPLFNLPFNNYLLQALLFALAYCFIPTAKALTPLFFLLLFIATITTQVTLKLREEKRLGALALGLDHLVAGRNDRFLDVKGTDSIAMLELQYNRLAQNLQAQDKGHRQWVADTSHELRTPIAVLRAQVEAFQDGVQEVTPRNLGVLHNEIMALNKLVDDLHWLAKYDVGQIRCTPVMTDIASTLQDVVEALTERYEKKELTLENTITGGTQYLANLDTSRLRQVFVNVMENSLRYTERGGTVRITAMKEGETLLLHFDDSAPGISDEAIAKIFDRFFRADSSRNRTLGGSGLGLAICKNNMQMLGGSINARHSPLGGVRIELRLPLAQEQQE